MLPCKWCPSILHWVLSASASKDTFMFLGIRDAALHPASPLSDRRPLVALHAQKTPLHVAPSLGLLGTGCSPALPSSLRPPLLVSLAPCAFPGRLHPRASSLGVLSTPWVPSWGIRVLHMTRRGHLFSEHLLMSPAPDALRAVCGISQHLLVSLTPLVLPGTPPSFTCHLPLSYIICWVPSWGIFALLYMQPSWTVFLGVFGTFWSISILLHMQASFLPAASPSLDVPSSKCPLGHLHPPLSTHPPCIISWSPQHRLLPGVPLHLQNCLHPSIPPPWALLLCSPPALKPNARGASLVPPLAPA